jgi:hypothetical protein
MESTAEMASGEMAPDEAELGVTFGTEAGEQAETISRIPQIASSPR